MKNIIYEHRATREYLFPINKKTLEFRLFTSVEVNKVILHYFKRNTVDYKEKEMTCDIFTEEKKLWESTVSFAEHTHYIKYYFEIIYENNEKSFLDEIGLKQEVPDKNFFEFLCSGSSDGEGIPNWAEGTVFYQIFPDSFESSGCTRKDNIQPWNSIPNGKFLGGNLKGIINRVDYLKDLGIGCIYLNPIFKAEFNHKYATIDYFEIDEDFGSKEDFKKLVDKLHKAGIRIILDGVFNHTSIHFPYFEDIVKNENQSKYLDWFYVDSFPVSLNPLNYLCVGDYCYMPKLNTGNLDVQKFILSVMEYWIQEFEIDGWRLDVADEIEPLCWSFIRRTIKNKYPHVLLLGECWSDAYRIIGNGNQLDITMNYLFRNACYDFFAKNGRAEEFANQINTMLMRYRKQINKSNFNLLDSHDTERFLTSCSYDENMLKLAWAFQMFFIGSPSVYYGDEVGMSGENDPLCRAGMKWEYKDCELHNYIKGLIEIRNSNELIKHGDFKQLYVSDKQGVYIFMRFNANDCIGFAFNTSSEDQVINDKSVYDYFGVSSLRIDKKSFQIINKIGGRI